MQSESEDAMRLLKLVSREPSLTPVTALLLAKHLVHIAGGDGRGVFTIAHDPTGDRVDANRHV